VEEHGRLAAVLGIGGIGVALACCSDIRLASDSAFFLAPFVQLGLTAEVGLGWLLPRLIGTGNALDLLMAARRVGADEALSMGLVTRVYPSGSFLSLFSQFFRSLFSLFSNRHITNP